MTTGADAVNQVAQLRVITQGRERFGVRVVVNDQIRRRNLPVGLAADDVIPEGVGEMEIFMQALDDLAREVLPNMKVLKSLERKVNDRIPVHDQDLGLLGGEARRAEQGRRRHPRFKRLQVVCLCLFRPVEFFQGQALGIERLVAARIELQRPVARRQGFRVPRQLRQGESQAGPGFLRFFVQDGGATREGLGFREFFQPYFYGGQIVKGRNPVRNKRQGLRKLIFGGLTIVGFERLQSFDKKPFCSFKFIHGINIQSGN